MKKNLSFDAFLDAVGGDKTALRSQFENAWEKMSLALTPEQYAAEYLEPNAIRAHWSMYPLKAESLKELLDYACIIRCNETLLSLAALMHFVLFEDAEGPGTWNIPYPNENFNDDESQGPLNFIIALGFGPVYSRMNAALGVPEETIKDTLQQIACYASNFHRGFGHAGIYKGQLCWLHTYMPPKRFFRIGRLEFCQQQYSRGAIAYKNISTGEIVALAAPGLKVMNDGSLCRKDVEAPKEAIETIRKEENGFAVGNIIDKHARISPTTSCLSLAEWKCVLNQGDEILEMHIPSGGGMEPELVRDSMKRAFVFFDKFFPESNVKALSCGSWILSAQLKEALPENSNILALQNMVHLSPIAPFEGCDGGLWFLFLSRPPYDTKKLPRKTSMQKAVAEWMEKGKTFCAGEMFITREEVEAL